MTLLSIVVPCYNEQQVLPETAKRLLVLIDHLQAQGKIGGNSHVVFVDDGSGDKTWSIIVNSGPLVGTYRTRQAAKPCRILILVNCNN